MNRRALAIVLAAAAAGHSLVDPRDAWAQPAAAAAPTDAARAEARERFDRGLRRFNEGDNAGALAEFRRAYDLSENVLVLYNIGLVYAQMGRAVEATDALDRVLKTPDTLSPERLAIARRTHDEQAARIAEIAVDVSAENAAVEVDGIEAGKAPLPGPLRVTSGTHTIAAAAPGFAPLRKEVTIASGEKQSLKLDLVPMQGRMAHLAIRTHLPGAEATVDDQRVGVTPLSSSVSLAPGAHRVELRRAGYVSARADVTLGDGATGEVVLEPEEDGAALGSSAGSLALDVSENETVLTIDGRRRGVYGAPLRLAPGVHHVLLERGHFEPFERDVTIDAGRTLTVRAMLEPTPEYRAQFVSHAQATRTWGLIGVVAGAVVAAGGVGLLVYDAQQRNDGNATLDHLNSLSGRNSGLLCDPGQDMSTPAFQDNCLGPQAAATSKINDANTRDYFGWTAVGLGAAGAVLGAVLLLTGDNPHQYDRATLGTSFWTTRGGGGIVIHEAF